MKTEMCKCGIYDINNKIGECPGRVVEPEEWFEDLTGFCQYHYNIAADELSSALAEES